MKKLLVLGCWLLINFILKAHPGIGIVKDSKGNIYYTDLKQVWKVSPDGNRSVVVIGVHSHELYIDPQDNLYGEHLWYNGESANTWGHYVWCFKSSGELVKEINSTKGFLTNYSFARDSAGNMYWVERFTTSRIMKKTKNGEIIKLVEAKFGFIGWLTCTANGTLYFTESNKLHKLFPDGRLTTLTDDLKSRSPDFSVMGHNYDSYGIWTDDKENVYLAMIDSKTVVRIGADGNVQTIIGSTSLWTVCSGLFDKNGNMWLLENSVTNEVRARKITKQQLAGGEIQTGFTRQSHLLFTFITAAAVVTLFFLLKMILNKRRNKPFYNII